VVSDLDGGRHGYFQVQPGAIREPEVDFRAGWVSKNSAPQKFYGFLPDRKNNPIPAIPVGVEKDISETLEEVLRQTGEVTVPAYGFSMGGALGKAVALVIRAARAESVRCGDVVVFRRFDRWVAHRLIWKFGAKSEFVGLTKGDAVRGADRPCAKKTDVIGVVVACKFGERIDMLNTMRARCLAAIRVVIGLLTAV
jgi:hypothetical protein